jgi:exodeoxyribonuclease-3
MRKHMLRILDLNLNGIRSAANKGFFEWLATQQADIVCVQELKAQLADLTPACAPPPDSPAASMSLKRRATAASASIPARPRIASSKASATPNSMPRGATCRPTSASSVVSLYLPSGSSSDERQQAKFRFLDQFRPQLERLASEARRDGREVLLCGDWNIAHREIDLKNWKSNQKNSGFLPEERAWLSAVFDDLGWVDVHRRLQPEAGGEAYTWWSNRGQAWANNVGWRIDYQIATPGLAATALHAAVYKESRFSDHAPLIIDYDLTLP